MNLTSRESEIVFRIMGELSAGHSSHDLRVCLCPLLRDLPVVEQNLAFARDIDEDTLAAHMQV